MIAAVEGTLQRRGSDWAIIKTGGVSLQVHVAGPTLSQLGAVGDTVELFTYLHWKEDSIALYGFASEQDLEMFKLLISVNGVGPKLALGMLSSMDAEKLSMAVANGNVDLLTGLPGVGRKTASRLVVELKGKLAKEGMAVSSFLTDENAEVVAALTKLGYSATEAARAVAELPRSPDLSLEDRVKLVLRHLAS